MGQEDNLINIRTIFSTFLLMHSFFFTK